MRKKTPRRLQIAHTSGQTLWIGRRRPVQPRSNAWLWVVGVLGCVVLAGFACVGVLGMCRVSDNAVRIELLRGLQERDRWASQNDDPSKVVGDDPLSENYRLEAAQRRWARKYGFRGPR